MTGVPVAITGYKNSCMLTVDSTAFTSTEDKAKLTALENILWGTDAEDVYTEVTPVGTENPVTEGWYEKTGNVYVLSADTTVDAQKTYYAKTTTTATDARLPLPDEVFTILGGIGG